MSRYLFLNPGALLGGAERVLLDWLASLREAVPSATLGLVTLADGPLVAEARALGVETTVVPLPEALRRLGDSGERGRSRLASAASLSLRGARAGGEALGFLRALRGAVADFRPTLLHSNGTQSHALSPLVKPRGVPLVWHIHDFLGERPLASRLLRPCALRADLAVANSCAVAADTRDLFPWLPVHVVYNAVDVDRFCPQGPAAPLDALAGLPPAPDGCLRVGLVATYARWKGQDVFLAAAARLLAERPALPVRFYIVGGPLHETPASQFSLAELRALAERHGLSEHVGFVPFQDHPEAVFRALDVVVHASTRPEPFGRTIVEGMACARPVLVSQAGGAAELFIDGQDALGVAPGSVEGLARALRSLAEAPGLRQELGAAARQTAVRRFSRERLGREALPLYTALARGERRAPAP